MEICGGVILLGFLDTLATLHQGGSDSGGNVPSSGQEYSSVWRLLEELAQRIKKLDLVFYCTFIQSDNAYE